MRRRETLGALGGLALESASFILVFEAVGINASDPVLAGYLQNVGVGTTLAGLGSFYWGFKPRIDAWVSPKPRPKGGPEGGFGLMISSLSLGEKLGRVIQIAIVAIAGAYLFVYALGISLLPVATKASSPYSVLVPIVSIGCGIFLVLFAVYQSVRILRMH